MPRGALRRRLFTVGGVMAAGHAPRVVGHRQKVVRSVRRLAGGSVLTAQEECVPRADSSKMVGVWLPDECSLSDGLASDNLEMGWQGDGVLLSIRASCRSDCWCV